MHILKLLTLIGLLALLALKINMFFKGKNSEKVSQVEINGSVVNVEVADTVAKRAKGLMFRENLEKDGGMLFVFPFEGKHAFWMANTYIPLDIIWINSKMEIVHIEENAQPCNKSKNIKAFCKSYKPSVKAKYVLEVNAGWVKDNHVNATNTAIFTNNTIL